MALSLATTGSAKFRPIRRLIAKRVLVGLVTAWRLAGWPTSRSPSSRKATTEGVVRAPSAFSITFGVLPSMMATHELVVPRSIPIILLIRGLARSLVADDAGGLLGSALLPRPRFDQVSAGPLKEAFPRTEAGFASRYGINPTRRKSESP